MFCLDVTVVSSFFACFIHKEMFVGLPVIQTDEPVSLSVCLLILSICQCVFLYCLSVCLSICFAALPILPISAFSKISFPFLQDTVGQLSLSNLATWNEFISVEKMVPEASDVGCSAIPVFLIFLGLILEMASSIELLWMMF